MNLRATILCVHNFSMQDILVFFAKMPDVDIMYMYLFHVKRHSGLCFITPALPVTVGFELGGGVCLGRLVCFEVDGYYCSETTTSQACLL